MQLIIFDEELLFSEALAALLGGRGHEVIHRTRGRSPRETTLDLDEPDAVIVTTGDGLDALALIRDLRALRLELPIVALAGDADIGSLLDALSAGADGICVKADGIDEIEGVVLRTVAACRAGEQGPAWSRAALTASRRRARSGVGTSLTTKERAVLHLLIAGASTAKIAAELGVGEATVRTHLQHLFGKFSVHSRLALVAQAVRMNVVEIDGDLRMKLAG
jgi:DNA-binding NarL/FixJ family response regulator